MDTTIEYYNMHSEEFIARTVNLNMHMLYNEFVKYLDRGAIILDLGSGSGRDSKYFHDMGYEVIAVDPSEAMNKATKEYAGVEVVNCRANEIRWNKYFDGIWACASLLHVPYEEMQDTMRIVIDALKPKGIMYFSVKKGLYQRMVRGKLYSDYTIESLMILLKKQNNIEIEAIWESDDVSGINQQWINVLVRRKG